MDPGLHTLLVIGGLVLGYAWLGNRLMHATQGLRLRFVEQALELVHDARVSAETRQAFVRLLEHLFDRRYVWRTALTVIPGVVVAALRPDPARPDPPQVARKVDDTRLLGLIALFALSPLAALLFFLQTGLLILVGVSGSIVLRLVFPTQSVDSTPKAHHTA